MQLHSRLNRALKFQQEQNGHLPEEQNGHLPEEDEMSIEATAVSRKALHEEIPRPEEKVSAKEFFLMVLSAWGVFLPVCLGILILIILIARLIFRI